MLQDFLFIVQISSPAILVFHEYDMQTF